ncbi:hypothetical protein K1719_043809 [Acacia pycnantha]|nr:hypothetical protein K1719_043809 [Acacia pycnantha]
MAAQTLMALHFPMLLLSPKPQLCHYGRQLSSLTGPYKTRGQGFCQEIDANRNIGFSGSDFGSPATEGGMGPHLCKEKHRVRLSTSNSRPSLIMPPPYTKVIQMEVEVMKEIKEMIQQSGNGLFSPTCCIYKEPHTIHHLKQDVYTPKELVKLMLVDVGFIIELFKSFYEDQVMHGDGKLSQPWLRVAIRVDLLLLENQLPFFFLKDLYDKAFPVNLCDKMRPFLELTYNLFEYFNLQKLKPYSTVKIKHFTYLIRFFHLPRTGPTTTIRHPSQEARDHTLLYSASDLQEAGVQLKGRHKQINTSKDVSVQIHKKIVHNYIGDANNVAALVNDLWKNVMSMDFNSEYLDICKRVPRTIHHLKEDVRTAKAVSIGPLHHGGDQRLFDMEMHKQVFFKIFSQAAKTSLSDLVSFLRHLEPKVHASYSEKIKLGKELVKNMLVDDNFIMDAKLSLRQDQMIFNSKIRWVTTNLHSHVKLRYPNDKLVYGLI